MNEPAKCADCKTPYGKEGWIEAIVPDKVWEFISPTRSGGGLLCINCISKRLAKYGLRRIPVWLCGMEPLVAREGEPDVDTLRNWQPKLLQRIRAAQPPEEEKLLETPIGKALAVSLAVMPEPPEEE